MTLPKPTRILVISHDNIGDAIVRTPALLALRNLLPEAHICIATQPNVLPLLRGAGLANELIECPNVPSIPWFWKAGIIGRFDAWWVPSQDRPRRWLRLGMLAGAKWRVGNANRKHRLDFALNEFVDCPDMAPEWERSLLMVKAITNADPFPSSYRLTADHLGAAALLDAAGIRGKFILATRECQTDPSLPEGLFAEILSQLSKSVLPVVVTGTGSGVAPPGSADLVGKTTITQLAGLVAGAACVVSPSTATSHFASAFDRPLVQVDTALKSERGMSKFMPTTSVLRHFPYEDKLPAAAAVVEAVRDALTLGGYGSPFAGLVPPKRLHPAPLFAPQSVEAGIPSSAN